jgi:hypothetical protein
MIGVYLEEWGTGIVLSLQGFGSSLRNCGILLSWRILPGLCRAGCICKQCCQPFRAQTLWFASLPTFAQVQAPHHITIVPGVMKTWKEQAVALMTDATSRPAVRAVAWAHIRNLPQSSLLRPIFLPNQAEQLHYIAEDTPQMPAGLIDTSMPWDAPSFLCPTQVRKACVQGNNSDCNGHKASHPGRALAFLYFPPSSFSLWRNSVCSSFRNLRAQKQREGVPCPWQLGPRRSWPPLWGHRGALISAEMKWLYPYCHKTSAAWLLARKMVCCIQLPWRKYLEKMKWTFFLSRFFFFVISVSVLHDCPPELGVSLSLSEPGAQQLAIVALSGTELRGPPMSISMLRLQMCVTMCGFWKSTQVPMLAKQVLFRLYHPPSTPHTLPFLWSGGAFNFSL